MFKYIGKTSIIKIFNIKMGTFILILLATAWSYDQPYLEFIRKNNHPISWCIFPFFLASFGFLAIFYFCVIYINSDVPFMQHANMYQMIRIGRRRWVIGQIGGIFVRSFVITVLTAAISMFPFLGRIELTNEWGKVVHTLASQGPMSEFSLSNNLQFRFFYEILGKFNPLQLMGISIILCTLICTFLGIVMFLISLFAERVFAVSGAFAFVLLLFFVQNSSSSEHQILSYFVPTYWAEVALIATPTSGYYRMPSISYMLTFLIIGIVVMSAVSYLRVKYIEFNWENEDI